MESENVKILIVEDEKDQRMRLKYVLESEGYKIDEADSGDQAINMLKKQEKNYQLIITDLKMPGKNDGEGVLKEARKISPNTAVIIVTAYGSVDSAVRAMINGAFDYIQKPLNMPELRIKIERVLNNQEIFNRLDSNNIAENNNEILLSEIKDCKRKLTEIYKLSNDVLENFDKNDSAYKSIQKISEISDLL